MAIALSVPTPRRAGRIVVNHKCVLCGEIPEKSNIDAVSLCMNCGVFIWTKNDHDEIMSGSEIKDEANKQIKRLDLQIDSIRGRIQKLGQLILAI